MKSHVSTFIRETVVTESFINRAASKGVGNVFCSSNGYFMDFMVALSKVER